jgi:hypothetical protein
MFVFVWNTRELILTRAVLCKVLPFMTHHTDPHQLVTSMCNLSPTTHLSVRTADVLEPNSSPFGVQFILISLLTCVDSWVINDNVLTDTLG